MAIRQIREQGDEILTKKCREVKEITPRLKELIEDMIETMHDADGVGLAAPQVGVLRQIAVVDVGEGPIILVNPKVVLTEGEQTGQEGCLSVPGKAGIVTRPMKVKVESCNENMENVTVEGEELLARALVHEIDHLNGHMYTELVEGDLFEVKYEEEEPSEDGGTKE